MKIIFYIGILVSAADYLKVVFKSRIFCMHFKKLVPAFQINPGKCHYPRVCRTFSLTMNHEVTETDQEKAEMFNIYFSSQTKVKDIYKSLPNPSLHINTEDVLDVLKHLDISKACGTDLISARLLKEGADYLAYPYYSYFVFNSFFALDYSSRSWKDRSPVYK